MSILENLINLFQQDTDIYQDNNFNIVDIICQRTNLLYYLITNLKEKKIFDGNILYFSEILS